MYFKDLLSGLKHIHKLGHCLRYIKSENLFMNSGDFGLSPKLSRLRWGAVVRRHGLLIIGCVATKNPRFAADTEPGTKTTFAPENFEKKDVWSAGIVLVNMEKSTINGS
ncbi:hypothetical protein CRE_25954 [Caenorhabditis remanei]|uniref:Protein kinase domain-containing protein n=1 Tax=Caenorhabditis remanei TaxID=31234 RepID=E3NLT4_CAERE|nr:hypothetical protein CRE_25954 [Caenorhabditis remanei]